MEMLKDIIILLAGFVLLVKGADFFVDGSSSIARILKVPSIVVGLTVVAMGTSLPELSVSVTAALKGSNAIAISNVVGSNLFNTAVVLGACAVLVPITVEKSVIKREFPLCIIVTAIMALMFADKFMPWGAGTKGSTGILSRIDGIVLLIIFIGFMIVTIKSALNNRKEAGDEAEEKPKSFLLSIIFIVGGAAAIKFGGDFVVNSAQNIALTLGMSETLVGLTIVAMGTSLPELVTSLVAAKKGEVSLAVGNVVGSNLFNILLILGISAAISPVGVEMQNLIDSVIILAVMLLTFVFCRSREKLERKEGVILLLIYVIYMAYAIMR